MRALTLSISNKVEVHIQSGWFECSVSEYHSGLKTAPLALLKLERIAHTNMSPMLLPGDVKRRLTARSV